MKHAITIRRTKSAPRVVIVLALLLSALFGVSYLVVPQSASADPGDVSSLTIAVAADGTAPFDSLDANDANGLVRTNDRVTYTLSATYVTESDVIFTSTLPVGMEWDPSAISTTVCNGPETSGITNDNRTWTCSRTGSGVESFNVSAWIRHIGNGAVVAPEFDAEGYSATAPTLTVVAEAKTELMIYADPNTVDYGWSHGGTNGIRMRWDVVIGATVPGSNDFRGYEAPASDFEFQLDVPNQAVVLNAAPRLTVGGGDRAVSQPGGPGSDVTVSITDSHLDFNDRVLDYGAPNFTSISQTSVYLWIPYSAVPSGNITNISGQAYGFDPDSLGGASNFGSGYAPGQSPSYSCPGGELTQLQLACFRFGIDRTKNYIVSVVDGGVISGPGELLFGDRHGYIRGDEQVLPGQSFEVVEQIRNQANALQADDDPAFCVVPHPRFNLTGEASLSYRDASGVSGGVYMWTGTDITELDGVTIQYTNRSLPSFTDRQDYRCSLSDNWVDDPADLPGGAPSVTAIRGFVDSSESGIRLEPGRFMGMRVPLMRISNAAAVGTATGEELSWYFTYRTAHSSSAISVRHAVEVNNALVRNTVEWGDDETTAGLLTDLTLRPYVYGPVGGSVNSAAYNTQITLNLGSSCLTPVTSSLSALGVSYTYTPPNAGSDGIICTADDGAPGKIVFNLGTVNAPRGAVGGVFHPWVGGHETAVSPLTFQVRYDPKAQSGTTQKVSAVVSSTSDTTGENFSTAKTDGLVNGPSNTPSLMDRTTDSTISLTGTNVFTVEKEAITAVPDHVDTGEEFAYKISWANPTTDSNGLGTFVDVLPFVGDERGTTGLGGDQLEILGVEAHTGSVSTGDVFIDYTTDDPGDVLTAIRQAGNEAGNIGITWQTGTVPSNATALRFRTEEPIEAGFSGEAIITVKAPPLTVGGALVNDVYGLAEANGSVPAKVIIAQAGVALGSALGSLAGTVYRDLDYSGDVSAEDDTWAAGTDTVELIQGGTTLTSDVDASGAFEFPELSPGEYTLQLNTSESSGWTRILPLGTITRTEADTSDVDLLYQENVAAPVLADDAAETNPGQTVSIDVTDNDTLHFPTVGTMTAHDGVSLASPASYGTAMFVPGTGGAQGTFSYGASPSWPVAPTLTSYTDSFEYRWTNAAGVSDTATVTVTVRRATDLTPDATTIPDAETLVDVLSNDGGDGLSLESVELTGGQATVSVEAGQLKVVPNHTWVGTETSHTVVVEYTVEDSVGDTDTETATITVQRPPQATGGTGTVGHNATINFNADPLTSGSIASAVKTDPTEGTSSATIGGAVSYTSGTVSGNYSFGVTFTDNLGQSTTVTYTVSVRSVALDVVDESVTIPEAGQVVDVLANDAGESITVTGVTRVSGDANVTIELDNLSITVTPTDVWEADELTHTMEVDYTVTDGFGTSDTGTATVTVQRAPQATGGTATIAPEETATFAVDVDTAGTIEGRAVTSDPAQGDANVTTGTVTFDATGVTPGVYTFVVTFTDDLNQIGTATYTVNVQEEALLPVNDDFVMPDDVRQFDVLDNDSGDGIFLNGATKTSGDATVATVGNEIQLTPTHSWDVGELTHTVTVEYEVTDVFGSADTATATFTVYRAPQVSDGSKVVGAGLSTDFDGSPVSARTIETAELATAPTGGTVGTPGVDGSITYTAGSAAVADSFQVRYTDDLGQSTVATFTVQIQLAPVAIDGSVTIPLNGTHTFTDVASSAAGTITSSELVAAADPLAVTIDNNAGVIDVEVDAAGAAAGTYTFQVRHTDDAGSQALSTFEVTVQAPPSFPGDTAIIPMGGTHDFTVVITTTGSIANATITDLGNATASQSGSGNTRVLHYIGAGLEPGDHSFTYLVEDNLGQTLAQTFIVTVQGSPTAIGDSVTIRQGGSFLFDAQVSTTGTIEGVTVIETLGQEFTSLVASEDGLISGDAAGMPAGVRNFSVRYTDNLGQSVTADFVVTMQAPPTGTGESITVPDDRTEADFDVMSRVTGTNLQAITPSDIVQPAHGTVSINSDGDGVTYTPERGWAGTVDFTITVFDDLGQFVTLEYDVTVESVYVVPNSSTPGRESGSGSELSRTGGDEMFPLFAGGIGFLALGSILAALAIARRRGEELGES